MSRRSRRRFSNKKGFFDKGSLGRKLLWWGGLSLVAFFALSVIGFYQLLNYLQSDSFRRTLQDAIRNKGQAELVSLYSPLSINGGHISQAGFRIQRADSVRNVSADNINIDIERSRLWDRCLHLSKVTLESLMVELDLDYAEASLPVIQEEEDGFSTHFKPDFYAVEDFECREASFYLRRGNDLLVGLENSQLKGKPTIPGNVQTWEITLSDGKAVTALSFLRDFGIKNATLHVDEDRVRMRRSTIQLTPGVGELRAAGEFNFNTKGWNAQMEINKADLARVLNDNWKRRFRGTLFGHLRVAGKQSEVRSGRGELSIGDGVIEGLPILSELPFTGPVSYRTIELEKASCEILYPYAEPSLNIADAWLFNNIDVRAKEDKIRVTGRVLIGNDGKLAGTLRIGLPHVLISKLEAISPEGVAQIFNATGAPGFRWLTMNLSGTVEDPIEDLSARITSELRSALPALAGEAAGQAIKSVGNTLADLLSSGRNEKGRAGEDSDAADSSDEAPTEEPAKKRITPQDIFNSAGDAASDSVRQGLDFFL